MMEKAVNSETMLICSSLALAVILAFVEAAEMSSRFLARDCILCLDRRGMRSVDTPEFTHPILTDRLRRDMSAVFDIILKLVAPKPRAEVSLVCVR